MIHLHDNESDAPLGQITEEQLQFLIDELEETQESDRDYYVDAATIDMLESDGADPELVSLLRQALGSREGVEIRWSAEE